MLVIRMEFCFCIREIPRYPLNSLLQIIHTCSSVARLHCRLLQWLHMGTPLKFCYRSSIGRTQNSHSDIWKGIELDCRQGRTSSKFLVGPILEIGRAKILPKYKTQNDAQSKLFGCFSIYSILCLIARVLYNHSKVCIFKIKSRASEGFLNFISSVEWLGCFKTTQRCVFLKCNLASARNFWNFLSSGEWLECFKTLQRCIF